MILNAIPLGLNGLVTPTPLQTFDAAAIARLKAAFPAGNAQLIHMAPEYIHEFDADLLMDQQALTMGALGSAAKADAAYEMFRPVVDEARRWDSWGAEVLGVGLDIYSNSVEVGELQIESAGRMHTDTSVRLYRERLQKKNQIKLRGLMVTQQGPLIADLSSEPDPFKLLGRGYNMEAVEDYCAARNLLFIMPARTMMLIDYMTPHKAMPVLSAGQRIIASASIDVVLPENWRDRLALQSMQRLRLTA